MSEIPDAISHNESGKFIVEMRGNAGLELGRPAMVTAFDDLADLMQPRNDFGTFVRDF